MSERRHYKLFVIDLVIDSGHVFFAGYVMPENLPAGIYLFKVSDGNTRAISEVCSKLTIKTPCFHC